MLRSLLLALSAVTSIHAGTIRIDFGRDDGANGNPTISPDENGAYWNNFTPASPIASGSSLEELVTIDNAATAIGLTVTSGGWMSNGIQNGGLLAPSAELLGDFAVATATQDYFYLDVAADAGNLKFTGLDPARLYDFRLFASRAVVDVRRSSYRIIAGNGVFSGMLQTSGPGTGTDSYDGNDQSILTFANVQPDSAGEVRLQVAIAEGDFAYLGILEIVEGDAAVPVEPLTPAVVRIDFGRTDGTNGNPTLSPDTFGSHWNNFTSDFDAPSGSAISSLRTIANEPSSLSISLTSNWLANGIQNGGLLEPDAELLGPFAVATATQDYFFVEGASASGSLRIGGMKPDKLYHVRLFGTRNTADVRRTRYTLIAANGTFTDTLQTSGTGIGAGGSNGNDNTIVTLDDVQADASGQVTLQVAVAAGGFAYLGAMEIVETVTVPRIMAPPPASIAKWVEQDALDPLRPGAVLFVGSSSIRRWEALAEDFADYRIIQRGFGGSQLAELNNVAEHIVLPYKPSAIVMWEGTNDLRSGKSAEQVYTDFLHFLELIRPELPAVPVLYLGVTPTPDSASIETRRKALNQMIATYAASDPTVRYVDLPAFFESLDPATFNSMYVDGLHLGTAGYAEWTKIIRPELEAVLAPNKQVEANPAALSAGDRILFDFGPSATQDGDPTAGVDANGNRWNNWYPLNGGAGINSGERLPNLVTASGAETGVRLTITGGFLANGKRNGGLMAPDGPSPELLGDLALQTATQDYFFSTADDLVGGGDDDVPGGFMLDGLDPELEYEFRLFGTRNAADTRVTRYTVAGENRQSYELQTSGSGIGSNGVFAGNDDEIAVLGSIRPDRFGQVFVDIFALEGNFAYLNALEIRVAEPAPTTGIIHWRSLHFSSEERDPAFEATLWGVNADPDGDGLVNFIEYATGGDPRRADDSPISIENFVDHLAFTFRSNREAADLLVTVERSSDLLEWTAVAHSLVSQSGSLEIRQAVLPRTGHPHQWVRLRVQASN